MRNRRVGHCSTINISFGSRTGGMGLWHSRAWCHCARHSRAQAAWLWSLMMMVIDMDGLLALIRWTRLFSTNMKTHLLFGWIVCWCRPAARISIHFWLVSSFTELGNKCCPTKKPFSSIQMISVPLNLLRNSIFYSIQMDGKVLGRLWGHKSECWRCD